MSEIENQRLLAFKERKREETIPIEAGEVLYVWLDMKVKGQRVVPTHIELPEGLEVVEVLDLADPSKQMHGSFKVRNKTNKSIMFTWKAYFFEGIPAPEKPPPLFFEDPEGR